MIPLAALVIPLFKMMSGLHLVNQHIAVILPLVNNLFPDFFFRQNFKSFPDGILMPAGSKGASEHTIFFRIVFPMMRSTYAAAAIYAFMNSWNSYLLPLLTFADRRSSNDDVADIELIIRLLCCELWRVDDSNCHCNDPTLVLFLLCKRGFVKGMTGSLKL